MVGHYFDTHSPAIFNASSRNARLMRNSFASSASKIGLIFVTMPFCLARIKMPTVPMTATPRRFAAARACLSSEISRQFFSLANAIASASPASTVICKAATSKLLVTFSTFSHANVPPNSRSTSGGIITESKSAGKMSNLPTRSKPIKQVLSETTDSLTIRVPRAIRRANN
jgi:hypothetical protein